MGPKARKPAEEDESHGLCPQCGQQYDKATDEVVTCLSCHGKGATSCCIPDGVCLDCEEQFAEDDEDEPSITHFSDN